MCVVPRRPWWLSGKESAWQADAGDAGLIPGSGRSPGKINVQYLLPRKSHGQSSLAGYSPWGCRRVQHGLLTKQRQYAVPT